LKAAGTYRPWTYKKRKVVDKTPAQFKQGEYFEGLISFNDNPTASRTTTTAKQETYGFVMSFDDQPIAGTSKSYPSPPTHLLSLQPTYTMSPRHADEMELDPQLFEESMTQPHDENLPISFYAPGFPLDHPGRAYVYQNKTLILKQHIAEAREDTPEPTSFICKLVKMSSR